MTDWFTSGHGPKVAVDAAASARTAAGRAGAGIRTAIAWAVSLTSAFIASGEKTAASDGERIDTGCRRAVWPLVGLYGSRPYTPSATRRAADGRPQRRSPRAGVRGCVARTIAALALLAVLAGCRGAESPAREAARDDKAAARAPDAATPPHDEAPHADSLRLAEDTLRDLRITIAPVESRTTADTIGLLGELRVNEEAYAEVSAPLTARIMRLLAAPGDAVRAGSPLVALQSREIGDAVGALHGASARVTLARQALDRRRALAAERITPLRSVEEAEAELAAAEAQERAAHAALDALGVAATAADDGRASTFVLRTPVGGTVLERTAAVGQLADPAKPLFRIADLGTLWLTVHAFERDAVRLAPGTTARVTVAALPGETFAGTITRLGQQVDPTSRTVAVRIDLPNPQHRLKPGMSASAAVPIGTHGRPVLTVPAAALQRVNERWCVFVPIGPGQFRIRTVARGRELEGEVEILDGLTATDRVISDGAFVLKAELDKRAGSGDSHAH